jgi:phytoene synthase
MALSDAFSRCEAAVRAGDENRYLATAFARSDVRPHLFALYAFHHEIAKTAEAVSQPLLGHIRLQWWRESLDGIYAGTPRKYEMTEALAETVRIHALPRAALDALIDARESDLDENPFGDRVALETYADDTVGAVQRLALRIVGAGGAFDAPARDAGIAYALSGLVRAAPYWAARSRQILPQDASINDLLDSARQHYAHARTVRVPRRFLPALLPLAVTPLYLAVQSGEAFDAFRDAVAVSRFARQRAMLAAYIRSRL